MTFEVGQKVRDKSSNGIYYRVDGMIGTITRILPAECVEDQERGPLYEITYGEGPGERLGYGFLGTGLMRCYADEIEAFQPAVTLHCEQCGAALDRDPDKRLTHESYFRVENGGSVQYRKVVLIGYHCHKPHFDFGISVWGKIRAVAFPVPESAVPEEYL